MEMDERSKTFSMLGDLVLNCGAYKAVAYLSPTLTVKATRKRFKGKIDKRNRIAEIIITVGKPNYEEREIIKRAKKEGKSFPLDLQVKLQQ
jgi:hypothetical protein